MKRFVARCFFESKDDKGRKEGREDKFDKQKS